MGSQVFGEPNAQEPGSRWPAMSMAEAHAILTRPGSPYEIETAVVGGIERRVWKHAPRSTREVIRAARAHGARPFLVFGEERSSFEGFYRAVAALAAHLLERGLRKGDRVVIAMRNLPEWPVAFYAASVAGAIVTPLNAWWSREELLYGLKDSGAKFGFFDESRLRRLTEGGGRPGNLDHIYVCRAEGTFGSGVVPLEDLIGQAADRDKLPDRPLPGPELEPEYEATIFYTSGTTGEPKGVLATQRNMLSNITAAACAAARTCLRRGEPLPEPDPEGPQQGALMAIPFFHVTGAFAILSPALHAGHKLVLMRRWDADEAARLIERERLSWMVGVPTIAWDLAQHAPASGHDLSSLVSLGYGGAAAAPELIRRLEESLPAAVPGHGWGMTETSGLATTHSAEDYIRRPTSCGAPVPVVDIRIVDLESGEEKPTGDVGELWVSGPNVVRGYWNKPNATADAFVDGWVRTGDLARVDEEGFLFIVDRTKDMLIRGGENIFCIEIENCLYDHPAVIDAAVIGLAHPTLGEEPAAVVTVEPGVPTSEDSLRAHVAARLAAFKVPIRIVILDRPLPRNASGKVLKAELGSLFES